ncbi:hypothetical protein XENOCAPTIV_016049 [Xenoophorus captivus]|uniref:G-protein coupled receptors family 1 profile domain-containing protein n=1 Tax=Xenoophorus captivus TaxID=1517983 RepID=A0ABV0Q5A6_9TELE
MEHVTLIANVSSKSSTHTDLLSPRGYTILAIIMGVFSLVGIILNVLVIVVTVRHRKLRLPLNYALVNLAVCDLGCAVFGGLPTTFNSVMGHFSLGRLGCVFGGFAVAFFGMVVVMILAFLITWLPYAALSLAVIMDPSLYIDPVISTIPVYLAKSSTVYNPIIYIFMNRQVTLHHYFCANANNHTAVNHPMFFVFQFRECVVSVLLCGRSPWPPEAQISDAATTVASANKNNRVVLKQSSKE